MLLDGIHLIYLRNRVYIVPIHLHHSSLCARLASEVAHLGGSILLLTILFKVHLMLTNGRLLNHRLQINVFVSRLLIRKRMHVIFMIHARHHSYLLI